MPGALSGLKIADFCQLTAGHLTTKMLADYGATVIVIESAKSAMGRTSGPFKDGIPGPDRATQHAYNNPNKYSLALDLTKPEAIEVAKKLVAWSDVVVENYRPGVMEKFGLAFEDLQELNPNIVMLRLSSQGQTGPFRNARSYGLHLHALFGLAHFVGWEDRDPTGLMFAYPDFFVPFFANAALLGALEMRRQTGKAQLVDLSQAEVCAQFLSPNFLEAQANGRDAARRGNQHSYAAPHNAYPCQGADRWIAIATMNDGQWNAFCQVLSNPAWTKEPRFATFAARKQHEVELDKLISVWTAQRTAEDLQHRLQAVGVPAGLVATGEDLTKDPQLQARDFLWTLPHTEMGPLVHLGQPSILSATPAQPKLPAPCLGEHNEYVCTNILGMSDTDFVSLMETGIFA